MMKQVYTTDLANRIDAFLSRYGKKGHDGDWNGPDSTEMECTAIILREGGKPSRIPWSEWSSGCYVPFTSEDGRHEHDMLLKDIGSLIKDSRL